MYLIEPKIVDLEDIKFSVIKPSRIKTVLTFLVAVGLNSMWIFNPGTLAVTFVVFPIVAYLAVKTWNKYTPKILQDYLVNNFRKYSLRKKGHKVEDEKLVYKLGEMALGLALSKDRDYFLEAEIIDVDLTKIRETMKERIIDLISACLGIVALIGVIMRNTIYIGRFGPDVVNNYIGLLIITLIFSPVLVAWLIPVIWVLRDARIKTINDERHIDDYFEFVRKGSLSRFLGIAGFLGGYSIISEIVEFKNPGSSFIQISIQSLGFLILAILTVAGTSYFVGMLYLFTKHEDITNDLRTVLSHYIPVGLTSVRQALPEEVEYFKEHETVYIHDVWGGKMEEVKAKDYESSEIYQNIPKAKSKDEDISDPKSDEISETNNSMADTRNSDADSPNEYSGES